MALLRPHETGQKVPHKAHCRPLRRGLGLHDLRIDGGSPVFLPAENGAEAAGKVEAPGRRTSPPSCRAKAPRPRPPTTAPMTQLMRLAEILGAIHYLRELCGASEGQVWREQMKEILRNEGTTAVHHAKLVSAFNDGYRGYRRSYRTCTHSATSQPTASAPKGRRSPRRSRRTRPPRGPAEGTPQATEGTSQDAPAPAAGEAGAAPPPAQRDRPERSTPEPALGATEPQRLRPRGSSIA